MKFIEFVLWGSLLFKKSAKFTTLLVTWTLVGAIPKDWLIELTFGA